MSVTTWCVDYSILVRAQAGGNTHLDCGRGGLLGPGDCGEAAQRRGEWRRESGRWRVGGEGRVEVEVIVSVTSGSWAQATSPNHLCTPGGPTDV